MSTSPSFSSACPLTWAVTSCCRWRRWARDWPSACHWAFSPVGGRSWRSAALAVAGVVQTVPSLALLALMVLLLAGRIGFLPAFIALALYSILPILANTITGIRGVDPALTEAARGLGMTEGQVLVKVQLPLAMPVLIAGIRTATVLVVGTATLVTPVGGVSLGNYIFTGLESLNHLATVFGCVVAALLAVALDQLIRLLEVASRQRSRRLGWIGAGGLLLVLATGLYGPTTRLLAAGGKRAVVASGPFSEQHVLGEALALRLEAAGFRVDHRPGTSEGIQFQALFHNQVDCMVNYTGNVWTLLMKRQDFKERGQMLAEVRHYLLEEHGVVCLGSLGFENPYVVALPGGTAQELGGSLEGLAGYAADYRKRTGRRMQIGGDTMFFDRPEWRGLRQLYGLTEDTIEPRAMDATLMYGAVRAVRVQAIVAYFSDGRIPARPGGAGRSAPGVSALRRHPAAVPGRRPPPGVAQSSGASGRRHPSRRHATGQPPC